jgi:excisionase family DNA binding protein
MPTEDTMSEGKMLRVQELAKELRCSKQIIYRLAAKKKIPVVKVGRALRFSRERVLAALGGASDASSK